MAEILRGVNEIVLWREIDVEGEDGAAGMLQTMVMA